MTRESEPSGVGAGSTEPRPPTSIRRACAVAAGVVAVAGGLYWSFAPRPAEDVISPRSAKSIPTKTTVRFEDEAAKAGITFRTTFLASEQGEHFRINLYDHGSGIAVGDYDADGLDDIYFCNQLGSNVLYHNDGGGRFTDVTKAGGGIALSDRISVGAVFADYDGDGSQDLYVFTTRAGNALFRGRGDGSFEDVTEKAGLTLVAHTSSATFFDADGDGALDLLVTNTAKWTLNAIDPETKAYVGPDDLPHTFSSSPIEANVFYRNRGDGTFEDATKAAGLGGRGWAGDVAIFDYDGDGDLDVAIGSMFGRDQLYANDGEGHFRDVASEVLGRTPWGSMGVKVFDYDGDGRLDLLILDMHSDMWMAPSFDIASVARDRKDLTLAVVPERDRARHIAAYPGTYGCQRSELIFGNALYHALGGGRFEEVSDRAGVETFWPWGAATGDFDGDGFEDCYVPSGMGYPFAYLNSPLMMNNGDGTFTDRAADAGLDPMPGGRDLAAKIGGRVATRGSRCAAASDFDGDGRVDLVVGNFNDAPLLLMNRSPSRSFIEFKLTGTGGNLDAIGALVTLTVGGRTLVRQVQATGGYLAQSSSTLHFGLGAATKVDQCEVRWPDGRIERVESPVIGTRNLVRERTN